MLTTHPPALDRWTLLPGGAAWLAELPRVCNRLLLRWDLQIEDDLSNSCALVLGVRRGDERFVLKLNPPDGESRHEADALLFWQEGGGCASVVDVDDAARALLLRRLHPGSELLAVDADVALAAMPAIYRAIWRPAPEGHPFALLRDEVTRWQAEVELAWDLHGRPLPEELFDLYRSLGPHLAATQGEGVVAHQDLHDRNVLLDGDVWKVIDPKPVVGERAFDVASFVRGRREWLAQLDRPHEVIGRRADVLADALDLDVTRVLGWTFVHTVAWSMDRHEVNAPMVAAAGWVADAMV